MIMKLLLTLLVVFAVSIAGWRIASRQFMNRIPEPKPTSMANQPAEVLTIAVTGNNFRFNPETIKVKLGQTVKIVLTSTDMPHDFDLDELQVNGPVTQPGATSTVTFTADKSGQFEYYCSVGIIGLKEWLVP